MIYSEILIVNSEDESGSDFCQSSSPVLRQPTSHHIYEDIGEPSSSTTQSGRSYLTPLAAPPIRQSIELSFFYVNYLGRCTVSDLSKNSISQSMHFIAGHTTFLDVKPVNMEVNPKF